MLERNIVKRHSKLQGRYTPEQPRVYLLQLNAHLLAAVDRLREQPDDVPLPEAIYALIDSVITTVAENETRVLAIYNLADQTPAVQAQFSDLWVRWCDAVADEVARRYKGPSPELVARLAAASANVVIDVSIQAWAESGGKANMGQIVNQALELMRAGEVPIATAR